MSETQPANGLFGPGIFGTGIDLSALDEDTAHRLGIFFGEQIKAGRDQGFVAGYEHAESILQRSRPATT